MSTKVKVIPARDFLRATAEGVLDVAESERLLLALVEAATELNDFEVILDVRNAQSALSVGDLWDLAAKLAKHPRTFGHRTAVLCPAERFDRGEFFALCARAKGLNLSAFSSYEEAMEWLMSERSDS